ncbi:MAG: 2Fe-2S iron-sulfur cluster-binding protein [Rhizonema sp. PD38]|nr:2Fe-2S iron-sulfur cluster-binding protein [Rhizonema sp. PD38]
MRSVTAAATTCSFVILAAAVVIGVTNFKDKSAYRFGVYFSLLAASGAAIFGAVLTDRINSRTSAQDLSEQQSSQPAERQDSQIWKDWRNFAVVRKVKESAEITSFYLQPKDKREIPNFQAGQFLTIKLDIPGKNRPVIRNYSLSDYTDPCEYYRLSIKRELAPEGLEVPDGVVSSFMHDHIHEGSVISVKPPNGTFVLDAQKSIPAVFISNGVGITPLLSMVKACSKLNPNRPLLFVHGARNGNFHACRDEIMAIAQQNPNLQLHFRYSRPSPEDEGYYHSIGYVDISVIQQLVEQEAEYYLCGSPLFLQSTMQGLKAWGVPDSRVFFESFGKSSQSSETIPPAVTVGDGIEEAEIVFARSNKTLTWKMDDGSILDFAEANGINPPYSCRSGICGTCMCKILEGEVVYQDSPSATIDEGSVLICISEPGTSKVVLNI